MYQEFLKWLEKEIRYRGFFFLLLAFGLAIFLTAFFEMLLVGFPGWRVAIMFSICASLFLSLPVVYILGEAYRNAEITNQKADLLLECLTQLALIKEGVESNQVYLLAKGYTHYPSYVREVSELLKLAAGEKIEIRVMTCSSGGPYKISLSLPEPDDKQELLT